MCIRALDRFMAVHLKVVQEVLDPRKAIQDRLVSDVAGPVTAETSVLDATLEVDRARVQLFVHPE